MHLMSCRRIYIKFGWVRIRYHKYVCICIWVLSRLIHFLMSLYGDPIISPSIISHSHTLWLIEYWSTIRLPRHPSLPWLQICSGMKLSINMEEFMLISKCRLFDPLMGFSNTNHSIWMLAMEIRDSGARLLLVLELLGQTKITITLKLYWINWSTNPRSDLSLKGYLNNLEDL